MATVKVFPRLDKIAANGKAPVYLRVTKNRKSKYVALDVYIDPDDWNKENGKVKPSAVNAAYINNYLTSKEAEAEAISLEMETKSKFITAYDIKSKILGKAPSDFFSYVKKREQIVNQEYSIGTARRYKCVVEKLKSFCKRDVLYFDEINVELIKDFQEFLLVECKNHVNTVNANLKVIRKLLTDAIVEELMPIEKHPFKKIKLKTVPTKRDFLLDEELEKLEKLRLPKYSQMNHHRNMYIFSAYAYGIRISDLLMMRWQNLSDDHLYFQIRKNMQPLGIKLPPKAMEILRFYRVLEQRKCGKGKINSSSFIFPLLRIDCNDLDKRRIHNAISSATSYTNKDLRKLKDKAGIDKKVSFHTARHSWVVRALQKGMRIEYVSKLMGRASVKHTEGYAKILNADLDKAMEIFN